MWWIEHLEPEDEWDEESQLIWVLYAVTPYKSKAEKYMNRKEYRVSFHAL